MPKFRHVVFASTFFIAGLLGSSAIAQTGGLKGKVRATSGTGIASAAVTARRDGKDVKTVESDPKGNFIIDGLEPGRYNIAFDARGFSTGVLYNVEVRANSTRDLGERLLLARDLGSLVLIRGSVFYREGTSVTGAKVSIERLNSDGSWKTIDSAYSTVSGEFGFRQPEGAAKFRITAKFKGASSSKELEVFTAAVYRLALTLDISRTEK